VGGADATLDLVDGGKVGRLLDPEPGAAIAHTALLEDGSVAAIVERSGVGRLVTIDREGQRRLQVPLPPGKWRCAGEPRPGWLALTPGFYVPKTVFVDLGAGKTIRTEEGLSAIAGFGGHDDSLPAGSPGSRLFVGSRGEVVLLDPETGRREAVLVPPRSRED
jgi:hypothetical protein